MAEGENKSQSFGASDERYKYIGFEVFPGKAGDIFKSDTEKQSLIQKVMAKFNRSEGEVRDRCTLMEERVSNLERGFLTFAAVLMFAALFLPWFSGYFEITSTKQVLIEEVPAAVADSTAAGPDSLAAAAADSVTPVVPEGSAPVEEAVAEPIGEEMAATGEGAAIDTTAAVGAVVGTPDRFRTVTEVTHDNRSLSGFGAIFSIGEYGSLVFSSGLVLVVTGILFIAYVLCCIGLAAFNLYLLYGIKKANSEDYALMLKNKLRFNWIPIYIWLAMLALSFVGAGYGFDSESMLKQVGESYSTASFVGLTSIGLYVSLAAFVMAALKGKEI